MKNNEICDSKKKEMVMRVLEGGRVTGDATTSDKRREGRRSDQERSCGH